MRALEEEAAYHNSVHRLQVDYTLHLFAALRLARMQAWCVCVLCLHACTIGWTIYLHSEGYEAFQQSVTGGLSAPLRGQHSAMSRARWSMESVCSCTLVLCSAALMADYEELCEAASEENLSQFLTTFKNSSDSVRRLRCSVQEVWPCVCV